MTTHMAYIILNNVYSSFRPYSPPHPISEYCTSRSCGWCDLHINDMCYIGIVGRRYKKYRKASQ